MSTTYTARVTREDRWWMVSVPEIDGLTQARRLSEAERMARELIAVTQGTSVEDVRVRVEVDRVGDVEVRSRLEQLHADRSEAARLERASSDLARSIAQDLVAEGIPLRDVGEVLGISHQRAHQLVSS